MAIPRLHKETPLYSRVKNVGAYLKVLADSITSLVQMDETYIDPSGHTTVNHAASMIRQNATNIETRVEKNGVISSINQSAESIKIAAGRVDVEGAAIFTSGKLKKVVISSSKQWYSSTSPSTRTGGSWSTNQPNVTAGRYLWERTYYTYSDGTNEYRPSEGGVCVTAPTDIGGTVTDVDVEYAQGTSPTTAPTSGWTTSAPTITAGRYLWTRTKTTYSNNTTEYTKTACISGDNGKLVTSAKEQYYLSTSSTSQTGGSWTDACPAWESGKYIWTRTYLTYNDGTNGAVNVTLATALNEANRKANATITGVDVEYADSTSSTTPPSSGWQTNAPTWQAGHYIWQRTKTVTPSGTSYSQPTCISGRDGVDGAAAYTYSINCNPASLVRSESGTLTPSSITFSTTRAQGTGSPSSYAGRFVISEYNGSSWSDKYTSSSNESLKSYSPTSTAKVVRCMLYLAGTTPGNTTPLDMQSVSIASNGTNVTVSKIEYGVANNASTAPTYSTTVPTSIAKGKWLWVRTTYSNRSTAINKSYVGTDGEDGTSIYVTSSTKSGGTTTVKLSDGTTMTINDGEDGANGTAGKNGYVHTAWANSSDGSSGFSTTNSTNKKYLGVYTDNTAADSTDYTKYSWSLIKGNDGTNGADGYTVMLSNESHTFAGGTSAAIAASTTSQVIAFKGTTQVAASIGTISGAPDGMTTSIAGNVSTNARFTVNVTTSLTTRQGTLTIPVTVDGKSFSLKFSWTLALAGATGAAGAKGADGKDGVGIKSIVEQYYLSTSDTTQTGGSWVTTPPAWSSGKYYWTRSKITWDTSPESTTYTTPVLANNVTSIAEYAGGAVKKSTQLWYTKADTTAPSKPTSKITSTSTASSAWRVVVPTYSSAFPIYYYCWQYEAMDGTCSWSDVVLDYATTENQGSASSAQSRTQRIWRSSTSGTNSMSGTTTWVTRTSDTQNAWTATRPTYSSDYPVIWTATQSQSVRQQSEGLVCSCTTPVKDNTTIINGDQITTGTIDAAKVAVTHLDASKITSGTIDAARIGANSIAVGKLSSDVQSKLGNIDRETAYRGICTTYSSNSPKVVTCTGFELAEGAVIVVYNTTANTASGKLTLNVNNTGAKTIYVSGGATSSANALLWAVGSSITYVYKDGYWYVADNPGSYIANTCNTAASNGDKVASCPACVIFNGVSVKIPMTYRNTSEGVALNVQATVNAAVFFGSTTTPPTVANGYSWKNNSLVDFVFDGQYWRTGSRTYIDGGDIVTGTIDAAVITVNNLDASKITTGTLSANRIDTNSIKAQIINAIEITGEKIKGGTISGVVFNSTGSNSKVTIDNGVISFQLANGSGNLITASYYAGYGFQIAVNGSESGKQISIHADEIRLQQQPYMVRIHRTQGVRVEKYNSSATAWTTLASWS